MQRYNEGGKVNPKGVPVLIAPQPGGFYQNKPYENMRNRLFNASLAFGSLQIVFGLLAICLNVVSLHRWLIASTSIDSSASVGHGFWIGSIVSTVQYELHLVYHIRTRPSF